MAVGEKALWVRETSLKGVGFLLGGGKMQESEKLKEGREF